MTEETAITGTILVVDDTPTNLEVLFDFLSNAGFKVLFAEDGESALETVTYAAPDLILLDILMPGMDGFETCRRLKEKETTASIPVIFLTALTDVSDKVKGFELGAVDFITKPLQYEEVLARVRTHLRLQALTRQLQELTLTQAQLLEQETRQRQELARSNDELQQFAYIASHDLQEPLRMVTSYLQLLERRYKGQLDADADDFIQFAVDGALRMRILINDLLAFSRISTRGQSFELTSAADAVQRAMANLKLAIEESAAVITIGELPQVYADPTQLTQVFQNLLSNATKFCGDAPCRVTLEANQKEDVWLFSVQDNGIGLDPEYGERIFVIFQRLNNRMAYPGTGIGLAVCKKIVERHGGNIWVESAPDQGATFYFTIPAGGPTRP